MTVGNASKKTKNALVSPLFVRYELKEVVGEGSFGTIVRAADRAKDKTVAIKFLKRGREGHFLENERDILELVRDSRHENKDHVLRLEDFFYHENSPCLVMEFVRYSLLDLMQRRKILPEETAKIGYSLLLALEALSRAVAGTGIVHGDIKPSNVMITEHGRVKLVDFGLSFLESRRTYEFCQSLIYRAPEVYLCDDFGPPIDIWSVGCILAECYSGEALFPSSCQSHHLHVMAEYLGMVPDRSIEAGRKSSIYFERTGEGWAFRHTDDPYEGPLSKSLCAYLGSRLASDYVCNLLDLLRKILVYDPDERLKVNKGLRHRFFTNCRGSMPLIFVED